MQVKNLLPLALGAAVSAQSLTEAIAANNSTLSSLSGLLATQPDLLTALGGATNITILAPSNDAFAAFLNSDAGGVAATQPDVVAALLSYHVLNGTYPASAFTDVAAFIPTLLTNSSYTNVTGGQVVGGKTNGSDVLITSGLLQSSKVITANLNFTGGVIHVIDTVLTIPASDSATATAANLTSLAGALTAADLVSTVDGLSDVTIFAPSNEAFAAISSATSNLTTEQLTSILTYHVVTGTVGYSSSLSNTTIATVNGGSVTISVIDGAVFVNSAQVVIADVLVANGVVHVIDGVLNPSNAEATPNPSTTAPAFPGASTASDGSTPFTSGVSGSPTTTSAPSASGSGTSSQISAAGAAAARQTGAMGISALFGGAVFFAANM